MQRDRAWAVRPYPCIGNYFFLDLSIIEHPQYQQILHKLKHEKAQLIDIGCCFGQDLRKLHFDGAPSAQLAGCDLLGEFVDFGYDLFQDRDKFAGKLCAVDFFSKDLGDLLQYGSYDLVFAADFFHCFDWDDQVTAMSRAVKLLKPRAGSMLFGRQVGMQTAQDFGHPAAKSGKMFRHNEESFAKLVGLVAEETGYVLTVQTSSQKHKSWGSKEEEEEMLLVSFSVVVQ